MTAEFFIGSLLTLEVCAIALCGYTHMLKKRLDRLEDYLKAQSKDKSIFNEEEL